MKRLEEIEARLARDPAYDMPRRYEHIDRVKLWSMCKEQTRMDVSALLALVRSLTSEKEILRGGLEDCTGGDLASGEGIYKAEVARDTLAKADAIALERSNV